MHKSNFATAVSWDEGDEREFRLLTFSWTEHARDSPNPLLVTDHTVTRTQIQTVLERMVRRPNNAWYALNQLRPLLDATPTKLRRDKVWMDAARTAAKIARIFGTSYRNTVRFSVAVHELADSEHAHELPFADGLSLSRPFDDHFMRPPPFYAPPSLTPPDPVWVLQATQYLHAYFAAEGGEFEYIQDMALIFAAADHSKALEKLNGGKQRDATVVKKNGV